MSPETVEDLINRGVASFNAGDSAAAVAAFTAAIARDKANAKAYRFRAAAHEACGDRARAAEDAKRAERLGSAPVESGDEAAAMRVMRQALAKTPEALPLRLSAARRLRDLGRYETALSVCGKARTAPALLISADLLRELGLRDKALLAIADAAKTDPGTATRREAARLYKELGEFDKAREQLSACAETGARLELAELLLWRGDLAPAVKEADAALKAGESGVARRLRGAVLTLSGKHAEALVELDAALSLLPDDFETLVWRGEARRRLGRFEPAMADIQRALSLWNLALGALINKCILQIELGRTAHRDDYDFISSRICKSLAPLRKEFSYDDPAKSKPALERALAVLRGNRSHVTAFAVGTGRAAKLSDHVHYTPRDPLVAIQAKLRFGDAARVFKEFDRRAAESADEGHLFAHRGEAHLWLGNYDRAKADEERALKLDPLLRWPNVGLAGVAVMTGRHEDALRHLDLARKNQASHNATLTWRAEAYRKMGQARKAVELCSEALEKPPFKPALWINFALAKGAVGDASGQRELLAKLRAHLPEFFVDAAKAARSTQAPKVLEAALSMLRGNRSSWMYLYTLPDGTLKHERLAGIKPEEAPQDLSKNLWMFRTETPALEKELAAWRRR